MAVQFPTIYGQLQLSSFPHGMTHYGQSVYRINGKYMLYNREHET
jgi:hypothetical protein